MDRPRSEASGGSRCSTCGARCWIIMTTRLMPPGGRLLVWRAHALRAPGCDRLDTPRRVVAAGRGGRWRQDIQTALRQACAQLRALPLEYRVGSPVALAFLVPAWPTGSDKMAETHIAQLFEAIVGTLAKEGTLVATYRCRTDHAWPTATDDAQRWVYPGVIVVG